MNPSHPNPTVAQAKVRLVPGASLSAVQRVAWPTLEKATGTATPVPLPKEPLVELLHHADGKDRIVVTCTCGKRIEIICET